MNHDLLSLPAAHPASPAAEGHLGQETDHANRTARSPRSFELADEAFSSTGTIQGAQEGSSLALMRATSPHTVDRILKR